MCLLSGTESLLNIIEVHLSLSNLKGCTGKQMLSYEHHHKERLAEHGISCQAEHIFVMSSFTINR